jgi:hypothetical protein
VDIVSKASVLDNSSKSSWHVLIIYSPLFFK